MIESTGLERRRMLASARPVASKHAPLSLMGAGSAVSTLAVFGVLAASAIGWTVRDTYPLAFLAVWAVFVLGAALLCSRAASDAAEAGRSGKGSAAAGAALAAMSGLAWVSLPAHAFTVQPALGQAAIVTYVCVVTALGATLGARPFAGAAWSAAVAGGFATGLYLLGAPLTLQVAGPLAVAIAAGCGGAFALWNYVGRAAHSRHAADAAAERAEAMLRDYEEQSDAWAWEIDSDARLTYSSTRLATILDSTPPQLTGRDFRSLFRGTGDFEAALTQGTAFGGVILELLTPHGSRLVQLSGRSLFGPRGEAAGARGIGSDVTELKRVEAQARAVVSRDVLTGLPNRSSILGALTTALEAKGATALLFIDLDRFKPVNDNFGHPTGDAVLRAVGDRLVTAVAADGKAGRLGGDEFAVVVSRADRQVIYKLAERIIEALSRPYELGSGEVRIGASIGIAFAPDDGTDVDELTRKADVALLHAKNGGRGAYRAYEVDMQRRADERRALEHDLRTAIEKDQLSLVYQPQVSAKTQRVTGFEALMRWQHPERGWISPADFIPVAEESGLITSLGEWAVGRACRDAAPWPEGVTVAVNLSPRQLMSPSLLRAVSDALAKSRLQPGRLELEVTETVLVDDATASLDVLRRLRAIGVRIALDDFGTGYSSLGYLNQTIFHKIKIDRSFVRYVDRRADNQAIVKAVVALAENFHMSVTAEGVETGEEFAVVRDLGVTAIQGYFFGKPMDVASATRLVTDPVQQTLG